MYKSSAKMTGNKSCGYKNKHSLKNKGVEDDLCRKEDRTGERENVLTRKDMDVKPQTGFLE